MEGAAASLSTRLIDEPVVTATCIVRRSLLGNDELAVQGQKHHAPLRSRREHGELRAAVTACLCIPLCLPTAWLLFMAVAVAVAGARAARGKGDRRGCSPGEAFPPAAYQDDGTRRVLLFTVQYLQSFPEQGSQLRDGLVETERGCN
jgi:hypothetical protein